MLYLCFGCKLSIISRIPKFIWRKCSKIPKLDWRKYSKIPKFCQYGLRACQKRARIVAIPVISVVLGCINVSLGDETFVKEAFCIEIHEVNLYAEQVELVGKP